MITIPTRCLQAMKKYSYVILARNKSSNTERFYAKRSHVKKAGGRQRMHFTDVD